MAEVHAVKGSVDARRAILMIAYTHYESDPRVMRAAEDRAGNQLSRGNAQTRHRRPGDGLRRMIERQFDVGQAEHGISLHQS